MSISNLSKSVSEKWRSWFFTEKFSSDKNGLIEVRKLFGWQAITVDGFFQSGSYAIGMLNAMLKKVPRDYPAKSILIIGLGGGGGVSTLRKRFPKATIVAIEHDPVMVEISKRFFFTPQNFTPEIITGDAREVVRSFATQSRHFDVVVLDIFRGGDASPLIREGDFVQMLAKTLSTTGYLLINFFREEEISAPVFDLRFSLWDHAYYRYNKMRVYRHFGQGKIGEALPEGFVVKEQSRIFLTARTHALPLKMIGDFPSLGLRLAAGFFALDMYTSDQEPVLTPWKGLRLIFWSPITRLDISKIWKRNFFVKPGGQIGITRNSENYWQAWSKHAQRHREKFLADSRYIIREATPDEFEAAYHTTGKLDATLRAAFMRELRSYLPEAADKMNIRLVYDTQANQVVAGLATVDCADIGQSFHLVSFVSTVAQHSSAGYGLIDDWYHRTLLAGINWLDFGIIWKHGNPSAWQGYSQFKQQFGLHLVHFPREQFQITLGYHK